MREEIKKYLDLTFASEENFESPIGFYIDEEDEECLYFLYRDKFDDIKSVNVCTDRYEENDIDIWDGAVKVCIYPHAENYVIKMPISGYIRFVYHYGSDTDIYIKDYETNHFELAAEKYNKCSENLKKSLVELKYEGKFGDIPVYSQKRILVYNYIKYMKEDYFKTVIQVCEDKQLLKELTKINIEKKQWNAPQELLYTLMETYCITLDEFKACDLIDINVLNTGFLDDKIIIFDWEGFYKKTKEERQLK